MTTVISKRISTGEYKQHESRHEAEETFIRSGGLSAILSRASALIEGLIYEKVPTGTDLPSQDLVAFQEPRGVMPWQSRQY